MVLNTPVLVESQGVKQGKKRDIISYPCCERGYGKMSARSRLVSKEAKGRV